MKFPLPSTDIIIGREPKYPEDIGKTFGRLTVLFEINVTGQLFYECQCSCGNICEVARDNLKSGNSKSCGCLRIESMKQNRKPPTVIHGQTCCKKLPSGKKKTYKSRLYCVWDAMIQRCENPNSAEYHNYGGRGIAVCKKWHTFNNFFKWAKKNGYDSKLTIDRIDVNGNYTPKNCRWATRKVQARNKRNNNFFIIKGKRIVLSDLCKEMGISREQLIRKAISREFEYEYWSHEGKFVYDSTKGTVYIIRNS
jgi:hypothetical protein